MKHMFVPMEIKSINDKGVISGYASIYGNVDLGGDVISKDAPFKEFMRNPEGKVVHLFQHDGGGSWTTTAAGGMPIGLADVEQNEKGLKFESELVMEDPFVQRVHMHMKAKTLTGMSIGFDILPGGAEITEGGIRKLNALKLWEISTVLWGMNPKAGIDSVKAAESIKTVRDFEVFLRDAGGFSVAKAKAIAVAGFKSVQDHRDDDDAATVANYLKFLQNISHQGA